jgi:hypothetical protein
MTDLIDVAAGFDRLGVQSKPVPDTDDLLEVAISGDGPDDARPMVVRVAGTDEAAITRMLMFSTEYPFGAGEVTLDDLRLAAHEVTQYLVLGHFEADDDGSLHLRYSTLFEAGAPPSDVLLANILQLLDHQQLHFGDYLESLCSGETPPDLFARFVAAGEDSGID